MREDDRDFIHCYFALSNVLDDTSRLISMGKLGGVEVVEDDVKSIIPLVQDGTVFTCYVVDDYVFITKEY